MSEGTVRVLKDDESLYIPMFKDSAGEIVFNTEAKVTTEGISFSNKYVRFAAKGILQKLYVEYITIQDVFGGDVVGQLFLDASGFGNDVTYKNVQTATFNGSGDYVDCGSALIPESDDFLIEMHLTPNVLGINQNLVSQYLPGITGRTQFFITKTNQFRLFIGGSPNIDITFGSVSLGIKSIVKVSRLNNVFKIIADGVDSPSVSSTNIILQSVNTAISKFDTGGLPFNFNGKMCYFNIENVCEYYFQDGDDDLVTDSSGNGNDGQVITSSLEDFRGTRVDGIDSVLIKNGHSSFQQIADPTKFIYAPYTDAGAQTKTSIVGYEDPIEIPKNVISDNKILYDGIMLYGVNESARYDEVYELINNSTTEITKTDNTVENLKIKDGGQVDCDNLDFSDKNNSQYIPLIF